MVRLEADATKVSDGLGSFGLACRDNGGVRYEARIDLNRTWKITRGVDPATAARQLQAGTSDVIHGDGVNRIAMECRGQAVPGAVVVALYVNEQLVAETTDVEGLAPGRVGVVAASGADDVEILFDDFVIRPV